VNFLKNKDVDIFKNKDVWTVVRVIRGAAQFLQNSCVSCLFVSKFWYVRNLLPQNIRLRLSVSVHYRAC